MGESDINLDSAALISAAVVFPIVVVIAGCAICRRLCGGNENEDEERQPLISGGTTERSHGRTERVESEQIQHRRNEPERYSPRSHSVLTGKQPEQSEKRVEETRQQEAQPVVVAEAALIPDLLRIDEQELEQSHQSEPDILEPRQVSDNAQSQQHGEHKDERAAEALAESLLEGQKPLTTADKRVEQSEENQEINVKFQSPTLHADAEVHLIPNLVDIQDQLITSDKGTEQPEERNVVNLETQEPNLQSEPDQEQFLKTITIEENHTIEIENEPEPAIIETVKVVSEIESDVKQKLDDSSANEGLQIETPQDTQEPLLPKTQDDSLSTELQDPQTDVPATGLQAEQQPDSPAVLSPNVAASAAPDKKEESQKTEDSIEELAKQQTEEESTSSQHQSEEAKETPNESLTEAEGSLGEQSEQATESGSKVKINFDLAPSFVKTIRTKAAKKESKGIFGLTILNGELFIINEHSPTVEVYDSQSLTFKHQFHLEGLFDPVDIKSSPRHHCIYIFDWIGESNEILRVASDGKLISKWKTGDDGGYISITLEANIILSVWDKSLLKEFTADGLLLREIQLSASTNELRIAIKLPNGHFIISQGETAESEHRVCLVDDKGAVLKSIGGEQGSSNGEFHSPNNLVVDESGFILVADQNNMRVVLLSPDLEFKKEVIQKGIGLRYPVRMDLDRTSGRLFVADNDYADGHTGWRDGRVMTFDFAIQH